MLILLLAAIIAVILVVTQATSSAFCWNSTATTVAGRVGVSDDAANRLDRPFGVALDSSNALYISDQTNNRVQKWLAGASTGTTVAGQASAVAGTTSDSLDAPSGVLLDSSGNIYVADTNNNRVQYWLQGASSGTTIVGVTGSAGSGNNELTNPYGIARDPSSGTLYIADQSNHRVMSYIAGASSGTVVAGGNGLGTANTQLKYPVGIYFDASSNSLIIANTGANNIVRWALGASSWTLIAGSINGTRGSNATLLNYPVGVTMDPMGNTYVADRNNHRIQLFLAGQSIGMTIAGVTNATGTSSTLLNNPYSMVFDAQLNLYVADTYNHRIQKFMHC
ncbi:unnamed protein product [Rotaria sordida]|uniref:NHL repeat containing protein n=2 Tax=Rotaria sordida TaxID=392033 RepID=A0A815HTA2_9BILA|nr:unnamed protein product [Rotaria sordida]CAF1356802.1 unnamed protein product [Rotaria sordida]